MLRTYVRIGVCPASGEHALLLQAAPQTVELLARLGIETIADSPPCAALLVIDVLYGLKFGEKRAGAELAHLLTRGPAHRMVGGHDANELGRAVLGREPLEEVVGM